jgi:beta-glucanase (GH16 family)
MVASAGRPAAVRCSAVVVWTLALLTLAAACGPASAHAAPITPGPLDPPTWSDEFDGNALDLTTWNYRRTGKRHDGVLTPDAVSVRDGVLTIKSYTEDGTHYSGMISTQKDGARGFEQKYGYFEARVKFHDASGEWSAFWLQSGVVGIPKNDPTTAGVEMDIAEHRARCVARATGGPCDPDANVTDHVQQGLIWDGYGDDSQSVVRFSDPLARLGNDSWHTFALSWTPTGLTFYYDDAVTWSVGGPISQHTEYVILSSEIAEFFAGPIAKEGYGTRASSQTNVQVDYVRVWDTLSGVATPVNTTSPVASGAARIGAELRCATGTWAGAEPITYAYQWVSDGVPIGGATTPAFTVRRADAGHALACRVTAQNAAGSSPALSNAVFVPAPLKRLNPTMTTTIACSPSVCTARALRAAATASVRVPRTPRRPARRYRLAATTTIASGGLKVTAKVRLTKRVRHTIRLALAAHRPVVIKVSVEVFDSAGNTRILTRQIGLRL